MPRHLSRVSMARVHRAWGSATWHDDASVGHWQTWLPGWDGRADFAPRRARHDVIAGLVLSAVLVPAGMAYAQAAGLPPVTGLYATVVPLLVYAVVGPSRVLVLGPDSTLAPLIAATVLPLAAGDPGRAVALAAALAIVAGSLSVVAGLARMGFVTELLSLPVRYGYLNGIAVSVLVGQLPTLLGFSTGTDDVVTGIGRLVRGVADGRVEPAAATVGVVALLVVITLRRIAPKVPGVLLATVGAMAAVAAFGLRARGVATVGAVPRGLPTFHWPAIDRADLGPLLAGGFGIAMVSFADTSVLSRTYAMRTGRTVDADRELVALGLANAAAGLFQGYPISASQSRTPVAEAAGARTQLTGVVGAIAIATVLVAAPGTFGTLPTAALAAVVISAVLGLIEVRAVADLWSSRRSEFALTMAAFVAVVLTGAVRGVVIAIGLSIAVFVAKAWRPHATVLVRVDHLKGYHDAERHPEGRQVPGMVLYRFDAPPVLRQRGAVPYARARTGRRRRSGPDHVVRRHGRADHRHRRHCRGDAAGAGGRARPTRRAARVRRVEGARSRTAGPALESGGPTAAADLSHGGRGGAVPCDRPRGGLAGLGGPAWLTPRRAGPVRRVAGCCDRCGRTVPGTRSSAASWSPRRSTCRRGSPRS